MTLGMLRIKEQFKKSLHQGCANLYVSDHNYPNPNYKPMFNGWLEWIIKKEWE